MTRIQWSCLAFGASYTALVAASGTAWRKHPPAAVYAVLWVLLLGFLVTGTIEIVQYWRRPR